MMGMGARPVFAGEGNPFVAANVEPTETGTGRRVYFPVAVTDVLRLAAPRQNTGHLAAMVSAGVLALFAPRPIVFSLGSGL